MPTTSESSRRAFLAALAASGATAAVMGSPAVAHAQSGAGSGVGTDTAPATAGVVRTEAFSTPTVGTNYQFIIGGDLLPLRSTVQFEKGFGDVESTSGVGVFYYSLSDLPPGARVTEITFAIVKSSAYPGPASYFAYQMVSGAMNQLAMMANVGFPQQAAEQYVNLVLDHNDPRWVIDNQVAASTWIVASLVNSRVNSVRVGWIPDPDTPLAFVPISPKRAYDSRFIAPLGPLANNTNRVVSVANGYSTSTATLDSPDIIPATARAIAYNITIANTAGSGFLSVNPGDATTPGGSSINWFTSGLSLANGLVVKLDANRQINVFCGGGGSTDFIIDILGYYR